MPVRSILCIRHGESTFNAAWRAACVDPLHFDAPLTEDGHRQVREARTALHERPVELVITSPLTRALQTATGLFEGHPNRPRYLVAHLARERLENSCDQGRAPALLARDFPALDFTALANVWWHTDEAPDHRGISLEPVEHVEKRAAEFRRFLHARPERCIAVVAHGTFLRHLTGRSFANCEVVELDLATSEAGSSHAGPA